MRKTRIHVDAALTSGQTIRLPEEIARHLVAVLRLRPGDPCWLFRGDGVDYRAELLEADKRGVVAMIHEASATPPASPLSITLIQGNLTGKLMMALRVLMRWLRMASSITGPSVSVLYSPPSSMCWVMSMTSIEPTWNVWPVRWPWARNSSSCVKCRPMIPEPT